MKPRRKLVWLALAITASMTFVCSLALSAAEKKQSTQKAVFIKPIKTDPKTWLADEVNAGKDVYLSANYLFQVMKLRSQKVLMDFESATLYPTLINVMDGMKEAGVEGEALVFVEVARKLLDPEAEIAPRAAEEVKNRVSGFLNDPQNTPRGHYASSEELKKYFRGMQFLAKGTFDVKVDKNWFSQRMYMLFPFDAAVQLVEALSDPKNSAVLEQFEQIHTFYDRLVGSSDLPSFHDLLVDKPVLSQQAIVEYARKKGLPKINKDMGVGIQALGERFSSHQLVIENLSQGFLAQDPTVNREKAFKVMRFTNILRGRSEGKVQVPGLGAAKVESSSPGASYYDLCLGAITSLPMGKESPYMMNTAAASLTALAEQTILVTKQTVLVAKSTQLVEEKKKRSVNIYVERGLENFLKYLSQAEENLYSSCGEKPATDVYRFLDEASGTGKSVRSDSFQGREILNLATPLLLDPTVTADVFFYSSRTDKAFLQWAIGPFEVEYTLPNKAKARGMEMVFFEGWHDALRKGEKTPMTNEQWRALFLKGQFKNLYTFVLGKK